jgi:hypothetical protein
MRELLQTVIPAVLTALIAGRVAITLTGRLRSTIQANVELLDKLPADHPSREDLYEHVEELVDTLVWREQCQFDPTTWIRAWIGFWVMSAAIGLVGANLMATGLAMDPLPRPAWAVGLGAFWALVLVSVGSLVAWLVRWWRERDWTTTTRSRTWTTTELQRRPRPRVLGRTP